MIVNFELVVAEVKTPKWSRSCLDQSLDQGPRLGPDFGSCWDTKRLSCGILLCLVRLNKRRLLKRSLSSNPKSGFDDGTVVLEVEVIDIRVGGRKLAVPEVNYR